ncbi:uncharacterized protein BKA78DRAFT_25865 [Phyllosticta capitalensis]|uniref:uncharacterized protein n=1 Tax=Phyllosticta capitalensis TaxID=121624 RepID=UPI00313168ED
MSEPLLLLNVLLPITEIQLGRLVINTHWPNQDFFQADEGLALDDVQTQRLENFSYSVESKDSSKFNGMLSSLLSGARDSGDGSSISLSSSVCITRQLQNSGQLFERICASRKTRAWLESAIRRRKSVYLVTAFKTVADAEISKGKSRTSSLEGQVKLPATLAATANGIPLPDGILDVGAGASTTKERSEQSSFLAKGEQVFAVQYRKVRISWFKRRQVDDAYLEPGNRWKMYLGGRGDDDEEDSIVEAELAGGISEGDLRMSCDTIDVNGKEFLLAKGES